MKPRERVLATLRRQEPDRIPFHLGFTPPMLKTFQEKTGAVSPDEYWNFDLRTVYFNDPNETESYDRFYSDLNLPPTTTINAWGIAEVPGSMHHFVKMMHPLKRAKSLTEIIEYPLPDFTRPECWHHLEAEVSAYHARDLAVMGGLEMTIFEISWYLRSMENLFSDMLLEPDKAAALFDRITELRIFQAQTFARAGVDVLDLGDDIAMQKGMLMKPAMWREWLKPRLAQVIESAKAINPDLLVWYHTDGDCSLVIPELIEIGVDILNPVQPECMDPAEVKRTYGDQLAFSGTIGTQTTMPYGTPEEIKKVVQERIDTVGKGGGLFLAPSHVLQPDVPWENVLALVEAIQNQR